VANNISLPLLIGIDIGGTFTDFVIQDREQGRIITSKVLSTPSDPSQAVINGLEAILTALTAEDSASPQGYTITHGSTVATNALLERKGARTALVTTSGFRDVLEIGRQTRPNLYDLSARLPEPIVPKNWRFEVDQRVDSQGEVINDLNQDELARLVSKIEDGSIESVAICLLFSFIHPEHEQLIARELKDSGFYVSQSSQVLPEYREYERTSTTVLNAYVTPIIDRYLGSLESSISDVANPFRLRIMQSNGGIIGVNEARQAGVRCIVSGPAGGVVGASHIAKSAHSKKQRKDDLVSQDATLKLITFDMGGTSTDVSLVDQHPEVSTESIVGGYPIGIPMLDIHTIGAGGGSIARVDLGGALRVGPESAGAEPGPACYAGGNSSKNLPTVTDANVVLGRLLADHFLGGEMQLNEERAYAVMANLGAGLHLDAVQAAQGVIDVVNAHMERALRLVTIERGHDPEEFVLLSFGGAGGLHAATLARRLSIPKVIIPPLASVLSAFGMLVADVVKDYSLTVMFPGNAARHEISKSFQPLIEQGRDDLRAEGFEAQSTRLEQRLDMRYRGQSYELSIPYGDNYLEDFHLAHERNYGYAHHAAQVEIVNIRLRATGLISPPEILNSPRGDGDPSSAFLEHRLVVVNNQKVEIPLFQGELLTPGDALSGPAVVVRKDTTVYLPRDASAQVDRFLNLVINIVK
jgi:N-methylhydantoinase A